MKLGFIGTSKGLTPIQLESIIEFLFPLAKTEVEIHYSNHTETDGQFHRIVCNFLLYKKIFIHTIDIKYVNHVVTLCEPIKLPAVPYAEARKNIIDSCDILLLAPKENFDQDNFNNVKYSFELAKKKNKTIKLFHYDGSIQDWPDENHIPKRFRKHL